MRSASSSPGDRVASARIRDAAIVLFGRDGLERTSVRAIAAEAGVSPGLVIHHFGSKENLRDACDLFITEELFGRKSALDASRLNEQLQRWLADVDQFRPWLDYLARMLIDDSPASGRLFDALLGSTRSTLDAQTEAGLVRPSDDPDARAAIVTVSGLASLIMSKQLSRVFGDDYFGDAMVRRMTIPTLELYTHGLYRDDRILEAARTALAPSPDNDRPTPKENTA